MQTFNTEAIILRRTSYGEADRILNLLTPQRGKISAIAKSVRKNKSKLAGGLELFATCEVSITEGRGEMGLVTSARLVKFYGNLLHDYERMQFGYELIKIINRAAETVAEPELYYVLRDSFAYLHELTIDYKLVELWFRLRFAALMGHGLNLVSSDDGKRLSSEEKYNFDFAEMAFTQHHSGQYTPQHIKLLRLASVKNPAILRHVSGLNGLLDECLNLVRALD